MQVVGAAELDAARLQPQQQVHLIGSDAGQPQPVGRGGAIHIKPPAQGSGPAYGLSIFKPEGRVVLQLQGQQLLLHQLLLNQLPLDPLPFPLRR